MQFLLCGSTKAYKQCISKGSSLTLKECIKICQTEDATCRQVQALCPESTDCTDSTSIHKIAQSPQQQGRHNFRGRGAFRGRRHRQRGRLGGAWPQKQDYRYSTETVCENWPQSPQIQGGMQGPQPRVLSLWKTWTILKNV